MTIKTVLCVLGVGHSDQDLKSAIGFCESHVAHLSAMVVSVGTVPSIDAYETASRVWVDVRQQEVEELARRFSEVKEILLRTELSFDVQEVYTELAWADMDIAERALYADLIFIGPEATADADLRRRVMDGALFHSPTPILANPGRMLVDVAPKAIMPAWDSSDQAARAARLSLDFLRAAETVHVVLVDPIATVRTNGEEPGADVAAFLARHGVKVEVERIASCGRTVDDVLRQHAIDMSAEMIVMGAYNHSRLQERLFGGVTRSMLEKSNIPLFLSH